MRGGLGLAVRVPVVFSLGVGHHLVQVSLEWSELRQGFVALVVGLKPPRYEVVPWLLGKGICLLFHLVGPGLNLGTEKMGDSLDT